MKKTNDDMLKVNELSVKLGGRIILENINISVKEGEILGIVGASGVGKTTLLNCIIGYYHLMKGAVLFKPTSAKKFIPVIENLANFKKLFGFSAQTPSFYPELSVMENLEYFASLYDMPANIKKKNISRALKLVQLENNVELSAKNLSGGMKKRLDIACAIVHNPPILILDEPTSDMDPLLRVHIWNLIEDINKNGTTIIVASHFLSEVENACDNIIFLRDKHVEYSGTPANFRKLYSEVKEIQITTKDGRYDLILKKIKNMPSLEVKHAFKRGGLILHSRESEKNIHNVLLEVEAETKNIADIEIRNPSMDMLFKLFAKK